MPAAHTARHLRNEDGYKVAGDANENYLMGAEWQGGGAVPAAVERRWSGSGVPVFAVEQR